MVATVMTLDETLKTVCSLFCIQGEYDSYRMVCNGNVNKTYAVKFRRPDCEKQYIVQSINTYAFENVEKLMGNIDRVTKYMRENKPHMKHLHFHHTADGMPFVEYGGGAWRLSNFIESVTYDTCTDPDILRDVGAAFGEFQTELSDFDSSGLSETIPDFHNTEKRIEKLLSDAVSDPLGRAGQVKDLIDYIVSVKDTACSLVRMARNGEIPYRVTHNDTKINNVLFDVETKRPICVIDLDTVMPGLVGSDFGDAVRYACNTAPEDSKTLENVSLNLDMFRAFTEGFMSKVGNVLTEKERDTLALSCFTITVELASRFLDDYLLGDKYFKTCYEGHNLVRAKCQLALARDIFGKLDEMNAIVREYGDIGR